MPKVEIDENTLVAQGEILKLFDQMQKDPATRGDTLRLIKKLRPGISIPEIDAAEPLRAQLNEIKAAQQEFFDSIKAEKAAAAQAAQENQFLSAWTAQKNHLLEQGYFPDGVEKIEAFARENSIPNLEAAAALYEKRNPPSLSSPRSGLFSSSSDNDDAGKYVDHLMKSRGQFGGRIDEGAVLNEAHKVLNEIRSGARRY
jgi:hypothetical protein